MKNAVGHYDFSQCESALDIAIVSDTHGVLHHDIAKAIQSCDMVLHAGDICNGDVLEELESLCQRVISVTGNNDVAWVWPSHQEHIVSQLPAIAYVNLPGGRLVIEHGHHHGMANPCHRSLRSSYPDARAIVYGHSHIMLCDRSQTPWIINPGAAGHTRTGDGASCAKLKIELDRWEVELFQFTS